MADVSIADFLARFPVFDGVPPSQVEAQLADANGAFSPVGFSNEVMYARAVMLLTAHNLVLMGAGTGAESKIVQQGFALDTVQSVSDSGLSVSLRNDPDRFDSSFTTTSYGRELARILRSSVISAVIGDGGRTNTSSW